MKQPIRLPASVSLADFNGVPALQVSRPECTALLSLLGGQVMAFQPAGERPVLWPNPSLQWGQTQALRQGSPVCWPWFGDLQRNPDAVKASMKHLRLASSNAHGLARTAEWTLAEATETQNSTILLLDMTAVHPQLALTARYELGQRLRCTLTSTNNGSDAIALSMALHSYLAVGSIAGTTVRGLEDCSYIDTLDHWTIKQQRGRPVIDREVDRIYLGTPGAIGIADTAWKRTVWLESDDSRSAVLWNPWRDKGAALTQFGPRSHLRMLCLETARVMDDHMIVPAGESAELSLSVRVEDGA